MGDAAVLLPSSQRREPGSSNPLIATWPPTAKTVSVNAEDVATDLISRFNQAVSKKDFQSVASLFHDDGYWRDHLALSWDFHTMKGHNAIISRLEKDCPLVEVNIDQTTDWKAPKLFPFDTFGKSQGIQFYITLRTKVGSGRGIVRVAEKNGQWKFWTFYTSLTGIDGHEEPLGHRRSKGVQHGANPERKNWKDRRNQEIEFADSEPDVLIVGAGQGGLTAHARLKMLNVPTLVIDKNDEVGDNWRKRYHQLVLHDPVWYDHMPYVKFPETWPVFTPKDKLAEWFECYAKILELNIWTKSEPESAVYDEEKKLWTVMVKRTMPDGTVQQRTLHPKHLILATGHSGKDHFPDIKGRDTFKGDVLCHSSKFPGARADGKGKKAIVVGACNSAHDICQDYYEQGYDITMVQRSTTCVVSSDAAVNIFLGALFKQDGPPVEDADLWLWGLPTEALKALHVGLTQKQQVYDKELLDGLTKAGFKLDKGPDDCGLFFKYFQRGGGYYFDVGASKLIIDGKIKVKQGQEVAEILPHGLRFEDGSELEADEIVFATGYENMKTQAQIIFGDKVADRVKDVWGFDEEGEVRTLWRKSGHPGFWFNGGNLALVRYYSKFLALQIKAQLLGLME